MNVLCAIVDETGAVPDAALVRRMARAGVPAEVAAEISDTALGRAALGVGGWQPMRPCTAALDDLWVAADARIDNRPELLGQLAPRRADDQAPSDAELLALAYRHWGVDMARRLVGDFAFAVWDAGRQRLFCARDAMGVKPLVWSRIGASLCVASRVAQIAAHPDLDRTLDEAYLGNYLAISLQSADATPLRAVRQLPAAHSLIAEQGRIEIRRHWQPDTGERLRCRDPREYVERFAELLGRSVRDRLRDCGPAVGLQLSGGLDSATVASVLAREARRREPAPRVLALSARFEAVEECDEGGWIEPTVDRLGLDALSFYPERAGVLAPLDELRFDLDSPFVGWAAIEGPMLEALSAAGGRVVMTGHGGDSLLYGSPLLYADLLRSGRLLRLGGDLLRHSRRRRVPLWRLAYLYLAKPLLPQRALAAARRLAGRGGSRRPPAWLTSRVVEAADLDRSVSRLDRIVARGTARQALARQAAYLGEISAGVDWLGRLAARFGIEARHPLLDRRIAELAVAVPPEQHYRAGTGKRLLEEAMAGQLPDRVRKRRDKTLFRPFLDHVLRRQEPDLLRRTTRDSRLVALGVVDADRLRDTVENYLEGNDPGFAVHAQRVATLERWLQLFDRQSNGGERADPAVVAPVPTCGSGGVQ